MWDVYSETQLPPGDTPGETDGDTFLQAVKDHTSATIPSSVVGLILYQEDWLLSPIVVPLLLSRLLTLVPVFFTASHRVYSFTKTSPCKRESLTSMCRNRGKVACLSPCLSVRAYSPSGSNTLLILTSRITYCTTSLRHPRSPARDCRSLLSLWRVTYCRPPPARCVRPSPPPGRRCPRTR